MPHALCVMSRSQRGRARRTLQRRERTGYAHGKERTDAMRDRTGAHRRVRPGGARPSRQPASWSRRYPRARGGGAMTTITESLVDHDVTTQHEDDDPEHGIGAPLDDYLTELYLAFASREGDPR